MKLKLYFYTLKQLKFSQIYYRILKKILIPKANNITCQVSRQSGDWLNCYLYEQKISDNYEIKNLNKRGVLLCKGIWNDSKYEKLWLYNLHYFDDLTAFSANERSGLQIELIIRWIDENPVLVGNGWEPYPTSLRIINWIKAFLSHIKPNQKMLNSLAQQTEYLSHNLERHLLGNHLFVNAKALIFAGLYFKGKRAKNWLTTGLGIYTKEIKEQVLSDGGNFELSPMYHVIMLVDLLDLLNIFNVYPSEVETSIVNITQDYAKRMQIWLKAMNHSDGKISFFNDSAFGIATETSIVLHYASELGVGVAAGRALVDDQLILHDLSDTGFISVKSNNFTLIADLGEVGPSYQSGHAHADTLSFEMSLFGKRIFVNSGISEYGVSQERLRQRQTSAHNTVVVNGLDSSQVWSGFRVAKRANIIERFIKKDNNGVILFAGSHDGFKKQGINCIHRREWKVEPRSIIISDYVIGKFDSCIGYLHLHPNVKVISASNSEVKLLVDEYFVILKVLDAEVVVQSCTWHPEFGKSLNNKKLCFYFKKDIMHIELFWGLE